MKIKFKQFLNESSPFKDIKNYSILNIGWLVAINYQYFSSLLTNEFKTLSQYKKYLNNIFLNKYIVFEFTNNGEEYWYTIMKPSGLSINEIGTITSFNDKYRKLKPTSDIMDLEKYVEYLKDRLIGQHVDFKTTKKKIEKNIIITDIRLDKDGKTLFCDENRKLHQVNIFEPITKHITRYISEIDPYGEEDWDDENENVNYKKLKKQEFTIEDISLEFGQTSRGCKYLKNLLLDKEIQITKLFRLNDKPSSDNVTIIVKNVIKPNNKNYTFVDEKGDEYEPFYLSPIYYYIDEEERERKRKKKEELKLRMIDIDPYGEEDWDEN